MRRRSRVVFAVVLALGLPAAWPVLSEGTLQKAGQQLKSVGEKAGHAIEEGVEKTGAAIQEGVEKAGAAIKREGQDVGRTADWIKGDDKAVEAGAAGTDAALEAFVENWSKALIDRDFDSWTGYWADDAVLIVPNKPTLTGRAEILAFIKTQYASADSFTFSDWRFETIGDLAAVTNKVVWGNDRFKQVIVLRETDGAWAVEAVVLDPIPETPS